MGGQQTRPNINVAEHQQKFREIARECQNGPVQERHCQDVCCLVTFFIFLIIFIGFGGYFIARTDSEDFNKMSQFYMNSTSSTQNSSKLKHLFESHRFQAYNYDSNHLNKFHSQKSNSSSFKGLSEFPNLAKAIPWIVLMAILAIVLAFVLVIAISKAPKAVIYATLAFTTILLMLGIIIGIATGLIPLAITCAVFGLFWGILLMCLFCCMKSHFQAAIILLKVAGNFIKHKPSVMLAPLIAIFLSLFYFAFFVASFIGIQADRPYQEYKFVEKKTATGTTTQIQHGFGFHDFLSIFWLFLNLFYTYFVYYCMVFIIATATALWYYNVEGNFIVKGFKNIWSAHIGSFTFASLLVAIVSTLKNATQENGQSSNGCACLCMCILRCCLSFLEEIIKVLNHNSVIVMSVTGQNFIDSAKTAIYLIYDNFGLFIAIDMVEFLLKMSVMFLVMLLPTGLGLVLLNLTYNQDTQGQYTYVVLGTIIIFIICLMIGLLVITILSQALSSVFIFFCLDQKFRQMNFGVVNRVPSDLRSMLGQIQNENKSIQGDNLYRNSNQNNNGYQGYPAL